MTTRHNSPRVPLSRQAQESIRAYITERNLRPGDALPSEGQFCELFGMSKASVREGIRSLEMLGIVEVRHGRGLFVGSFTLGPMIDALPYQLRADDTPIREILQVRSALEEGLIAHVGETISEDELDVLDTLVTRMRETSVDGAVPAEVDRDFHLTLFRPLGNTLLDQLIETFWEIYARFAESEEQPVNEHAVEDHAEIVAALRSQNAARMTRAIAVHFAPIQSTVAVQDTDVLHQTQGKSEVRDL